VPPTCWEVLPLPTCLARSNASWAWTPVNPCAQILLPRQTHLQILNPCIDGLGLDGDLRTGNDPARQ
jgi:hypothetical protein